MWGEGNGGLCCSCPLYGCWNGVGACKHAPYPCWHLSLCALKRLLSPILGGLLHGLARNTQHVPQCSMEMEMNQTRKRGKRSLLLALLPAFLGASTALAEVVCDPLEDSIPQLEAMKQSLALGHYDEFFSYANRVINPDSLAEHSSAEPQILLEDLFPDGFETCVTLMHRVVSERFVSEIFMLRDAEQRAIFFGWDVVKIDNNWDVAGYYLSDNSATIIDNWR